MPIGPDVVVFNLHRRYGELRLPMLLDASGLEVVDILGWDEARLTAAADFRKTYEPVFVLRKTSSYVTSRCNRSNSSAGDNSSITVDEL